MNKIVKVTNCNGMLTFVKAIKDNTNEQWEAIVKQCDETNVGLKWEYV